MPEYIVAKVTVVAEMTIKGAENGLPGAVSEALGYLEALPEHKIASVHARRR